MRGKRVHGEQPAPALPQHVRLADRLRGSERCGAFAIMRGMGRGEWERAERQRVMAEEAEQASGLPLSTLDTLPTDAEVLGLVSAQDSGPEAALSRLRVAAMKVGGEGVAGIRIVQLTLGNSVYAYGTAYRRGSDPVG